MKRYWIPVLASGLAVATGVAAQAPKTQAPPPAAQRGISQPATEINQLFVLEGNLTCTGQQTDSVFGPAHAIQTTMSGKRDLNGYWVTVRYDEKKTTDNPKPASGVYNYGWDPAAGHYVAFWIDSLGGFGTQTSSGWENGTMILVGDYNTGGQRIGARDTFTKTNAGIVSHLAELLVQGEWVKLSSETCHK